jgi:hypothetical protein
VVLVVGILVLILRFVVVLRLLGWRRRQRGRRLE